MVQLGIIHGINDDEFAPNDDVTRAQYATMLAYASGDDLSQYKGVSSFSDVDPSAWYAPQVEWAYQNGLIKGRSGGLFYPESDITREEATAVINRYAISEDSPVLEDNQCKLAENADEYLSEEEVSFLEALLADPVYEDEENISSWAADDVDTMSVAGIISGDENDDFNPQDPLKRSECVKIISAYMINDTKPTLYFPGGGYIEYIEPDEDNTTVTEQKSDDTEMNDFCGYGDAPDIAALVSEGDDNGGITVSWAWPTHTNVTTAAFNKLAKDRSKITDKMSGEKFTFHYDYANHYISGMDAIKVYSYYADTMSTENFNKFEAHFYNGQYSYTRSTVYNAYMFFNNHFYNAITNYRNGSKDTSYQEMGLSMHYLEDMNNPYHASNIKSTGDTSDHHKYEQWVKNNIGYVSIYNEDLTASYRFMYDNTFRYISDSFVSLAQQQLGVCSNFENNPAVATTATVTLLGRTSRAVTGALNRYFYYGYLNH